jgi:hypothetical protein
MTTYLYNLILVDCIPVERKNVFFLKMYLAIWSYLRIYLIDYLINCSQLHHILLYLTAYRGNPLSSLQQPCSCIPAHWSWTASTGSISKTVNNYIWLMKVLLCQNHEQTINVSVEKASECRSRTLHHASRGLPWASGAGGKLDMNPTALR